MNEYEKTNTDIKSVSARKVDHKKIILAFLFIIALFLCVTYMTINLNTSKQKFIDYAINLRYPKLWGIILTAFCIGTSTVSFQSVVSNRLITPCLLGMSSFYTFVGTVLSIIFGFVGIRIGNMYVSYLLNLLAVAIFGYLLYGQLFKKTNYNVTYVLLTGTVMASLFDSTSGLLQSFARGFSISLFGAGANTARTNTDLLAFSTFLCILLVILFWNDICKLDVVGLGRNNVINLGVDFDKQTGRILVADLLLIAIASIAGTTYTFLGIILSNLAREIFKTYKHFYLLLGSFFLGVICLVGAQLWMEHFAQIKVAVDVYITIIGGSYFLFLLVKNKGSL
ncbi:MAG: iron chelate uptake ABC transporter family permease subunit [Eubacteriales bacterium]